MLGKATGDNRGKLRGFLEGNLSEWSLISNDKESFLSKLLVPSIPDISHTSLISLLKTLGPRQVCQYQVCLSAIETC